MRFVLVLACVFAARAAHADSCTADAAYDEATLRARVAFIASKKHDGRAPGSTGDEATRAMIEERFTCLGLEPAFDKSYTQAFVAENKQSTANVVGVLRGETDEIILVAAHHDHLGPGFPGANDNASGIAALLAVAQAMVHEKPKRTIVFAAFGDEETGMHGSYHFAANPPTSVPTGKIVQVINLDMVGSSSGYVAAMGTFEGLAATPILAKLRRGYKLKVGMGGKARGSDFEPFCKQGTPYVFFWTPDKSCYHGACDTPARLDYKRMLDITKLAGALTAALAATDVDLAAAKREHGCFGNRR